MAEGWIKLYRRLFEHPVWLNSSLQTKAVLIAILGHARNKEISWDFHGDLITLKPGQLHVTWNKLIEWVGKGATRQGIRCALSRLERMDFITQTATQDGTLITIVNWGKFQGREETTTQGTTHQQPTNNPVTTQENAIYNPQKKNSFKEEGKNVRITPIVPFKEFSGDNTELYEALIGWAEMRKKIHKPLTERAVKLSLAKLQKLSGGNERVMVDIVNQSTMNSWQGLFPLDKRRAQREDPMADTRDFYNAIIEGRRRLDG